MKSGEIWINKETGEEVKISMFNENALHKIVIYESEGISKVDFEEDFYEKFEKGIEPKLRPLVDELTKELMKRVKYNCVISSTNNLLQVVSHRPISGRDEAHSFLITENRHSGTIEVKDYNDSDFIYKGSNANLNKDKLVDEIIKRVNDHRDVKLANLKARVDTLEGFGFYLK